MLRLLKVRPRDNRGEKWRSCALCDQAYYRVYLRFDSGSTVPVDDEVLTGATSADTGVVEDVTLLSGTWAGGDAAGFVELSSDTGADSDGQCFQDNEAVNGSVGGNNILTADRAGQKKQFGRLYPETDMVFYDGTWFCNPHFPYRYKFKFMDEADMGVEESDD